MLFRSTYFHHFRNIGPQRRTWSPGFNLIVGPNGAGKTNFIEGLNLISGWGPLERGEKISTLVKWTPDGREERASLWAKVSGGDEEGGNEAGEVEIFASISIRCTLKWEDRAIGATQMRNRLPVLSFLSGHLSLLKGGASYRRQLLDRVGALISPSYALRLHDYRKALRQKAIMLRRCCDPKIADKVLLPLGAWLWAAREEISRMVAGNLNEFSDLQTTPLDLRFVRGGGGICESPSEDFKLSMVSKRDRERAARVPLVGPQRDDVELLCEGREAAIALSQGQSRRAAAALLLASALVVERNLGRKPILIFDEVTAELDEEGREAIFAALLKTGCQIFAATTEGFGHTGVEVYRMREGRFME